MEIFVHQQNLIFFRQVAQTQPNLVRRLQLIKLLANEEAKVRRLTAEQGACRIGCSGGETNNQRIQKLTA